MKTQADILHQETREIFGRLDEIIDELQAIKTTKSILSAQPSYKPDEKAQDILGYMANWLVVLTDKTRM